MATFKDTLRAINDWLKIFTDFGLAVLLAFVIIDILFGQTDLVLGNIQKIVGSFADKGVVGLIALLIFLLIYRR
jgi:hypothetical protein